MEPPSTTFLMSGKRYWWITIENELYCIDGLVALPAWWKSQVLANKTGPYQQIYLLPKIISIQYAWDQYEKNLQQLGFGLYLEDKHTIVQYAPALFANMDLSELLSILFEQLEIGFEHALGYLISKISTESFLHLPDLVVRNIMHALCSTPIPGVICMTEQIAAQFFQFS